MYSAHSQSVSPELISSSGDYYETVDFTLSWSIGECMTETFIGTNNTLTQGFHQDRYDIPSVVEEMPVLEFDISVYPNPATDVITLSIISQNGEVVVDDNYKVNLTDFSGKILFVDEIIETNKQINFASYASGIYFLAVTNSQNKTLKSFKIIKN